MDDTKIDELVSVTLQQVRFTASTTLSQSVLDTLNIESLAGFLAGDLTVQLHGRILTEPAGATAASEGYSVSEDAAVVATALVVGPDPDQGTHSPRVGPTAVGVPESERTDSQAGIG